MKFVTYSWSASKYVWILIKSTLDAEDVEDFLLLMECMEEAEVTAIIKQFFYSFTVAQNTLSECNLNGSLLVICVWRREN